LKLLYRFRQFFGGVFAPVSDEERREADAVLNPSARAWFHSLPRDLQWHGLQVMHDLKRAGVDRSDVLAAALLHDAGKAAGPNGPLVRAFLVLAVHLAPDWSARRKEIDYRAARGIDRVLAIAYQHPEIAAQKAAACGCDPVTIDLIRHHQDADRATDDALLQLFRQIDDRN
jgi:23S rRNA maturation-related 3'-5' exoribonuclease YhaM